MWAIMGDNFTPFEKRRVRHMDGLTDRAVGTVARIIKEAKVNRLILYSTKHITIKQPTSEVLMWRLVFYKRFNLTLRCVRVVES